MMGRQATTTEGLLPSHCGELNDWWVTFLPTLLLYYYALGHALEEHVCCSFIYLNRQTETRDRLIYLPIPLANLLLFFLFSIGLETGMKQGVLSGDYLLLNGNPTPAPPCHDPSGKTG